MELNVAAWLLGIAAFFATGSAIVALVILGAILLGGFAWDARRAARFVETIRAIRAEHPDWADDRVFEEAQERQRR